MLDKMRPQGYTRETTDDESDQWGAGWMAVLDDTEEGPFLEQGRAHARLIEMRVARAIKKDHDAR